MSGLVLFWNPEAMEAQLGLGSAEQPDGALVTAILISLFSDRRARPDDVLPEDGADPRGWWGDYGAAVDGDQIGSRLWLLAREKRTAETVRRARDYAQEALDWLVDDQVASEVAVQAEAYGDAGIALAVVITRPTGPARQRFDFLWEPR